MAAEKHYDLTRLDEFIAAMRRERGVPRGVADPGVHGIHCPKCGAPRRVDIESRLLSGSLTDTRTLGGGGVTGALADGPRPVSAFELSCVQCRTTATALVYEGPNGPDLVILWSHLGGLRTPHTPNAVAYYLDQAARSESVAARSAAITMYRTACEQILLDQGFKKRMLGPKLAELEDAMKAGTAPKWASELHTDYLVVLKNLGNAATHAGDGDVSKQEELDTALLADVRIVVEWLLDSIYEKPIKDAELLSRLRSKADKVK